jgi:hypothetical protein
LLKVPICLVASTISRHANALGWLESQLEDNKKPARSYNEETQMR